MPRHFSLKRAHGTLFQVLKGDHTSIPSRPQFGHQTIKTSGRRASMSATHDGLQAANPAQSSQAADSAGEQGDSAAEQVASIAEQSGLPQGQAPRTPVREGSQPTAPGNPFAAASPAFSFLSLGAVACMLSAAISPCLLLIFPRLPPYRGSLPATSHWAAAERRATHARPWRAWPSPTSRPPSRYPCPPSWRTHSPTAFGETDADGANRLRPFGSPSFGSRALTARVLGNLGSW